MGALTFIGGLACILGTLPTLGRLHPITLPHENLGPGKLLRDAAEVLRNPAFLVLFFCMTAAFTGLGAAIALTLHMNTYFWALPPNIILIVLLAAPPGILLSVFVTGPLVERVEKRLVVLIGLGLISAGLLGLPLLRIFNLIPAKGPVLNGILIANAFLIAGLIIGMITIAFQAMMADAADAHEYKFGTRQEGLYYAGLNFAVKAAGGLGALVAGVGLDVIHFPVNLAAHPGAAAAIPPENDPQSRPDLRHLRRRHARPGHADLQLLPARPGRTPAHPVRARRAPQGGGRRGGRTLSLAKARSRRFLAVDRKRPAWPYGKLPAELGLNWTQP